MLNLELSNAVVAQAASKGLSVQQIVPDQKRWDGRFLLIEEKQCQIVKGRYHLSNPRSPEALSIQLYLPRTTWPDFVVYVVRPTANLEPLEYYIVPRGVLSRDTAVRPSALGKYRDAWNLLAETLSPDLIERRFAILNWQLRNVIAAARHAGLDVALVRRNNRPWTFFCQTRVIIAGRRCTLHSLSRISSDPDRRGYGYVALRKQKGGWGEFQLYVLPQSMESVVYVIPSASIEADTSVSIQSERLAIYKNNWELLA